MEIKFYSSSSSTELRALIALINHLLGETSIAPLLNELGNEPQYGVDHEGGKPKESEPEPEIDAAVAYVKPAAILKETDIHGLPWDERIHAGSKALNSDGSWRGKRNVDAELVAEVTAELRRAEPIIGVDPALTNPAMTLAAAEQVTILPPVPPIPVPVLTKPSFLDAVTANMEALKRPDWSEAQSTALINSLGFSTLGALQSSPELIPVFLEGLPK
jgi:hypothetical protein